MQFDSLSNLLGKIEHKALFLRFNPTPFDFTDKDFVPEMQFYLPDGVSFQILLKDDTLPLILSMLNLSIFAEGNKVFVWDWKIFVSYVLAKTGKLYVVGASIVDLKILESYNGIRKSCPETFVESFNRVKNLVSSHLYKECENIYKKIHLPLMTNVIPHLENIGILDCDSGKKVHAYYEIDGQENGRLRCHNAFKNGFVPHAMGSDFKDNLKPVGYDSIFMSFDFKGMEAFVLAYLSKDERLMRFCQEDDIYASLAKALFGANSENIDRELVKKCFLPVIYGQSARSLALRCGMASDVSERVVERISSLFNTALSFVADCEEKLKKDGFVKDVFGKRRQNFEQGKEYLARNFAVQSPAATICLEKLINLHISIQNLNQNLKDKASISYTVHDGYVLYVNKENWKQVYKRSMEALCGESEICPGLRLKVSCRGGRNLNDLKIIKDRK